MGYTPGTVAPPLAQALRASGIIVRLKAPEFQKILRGTEAPLVVVCRNRFLGRGYRYLTSYKGIAFYTRSSRPLELPPEAEIIEARSIWVPG